MNRLVRWLSSLRLWFVDQQALRAEVIRLRRLLDAKQAEHNRQLMEIDEGHRQVMASMRLTNAELRSENIRLDRDVDELRWALAHASGGEVERVSAAVRD
ncbi:hypothetical protein [Plantactinospora sp. WMMB782]|uniref:hypothetical protein n=1 Tax=Plantactinospora sp. WMMB782 TaxID=3404121 RepID=UPI003B927677